MTDLEKDIYNKYLRISRTRQNKPYKLRLNFEGFESKDEFIYVKKKNFPYFLKGINTLKLKIFLMRHTLFIQQILTRLT